MHIISVLHIIAMQSSMIPVVKGKKLKGIIKVNHRLALELAITKKVISVQKTAKLLKKVQP